MCYALGRSGEPLFTPLLEPLSGDADRWVREEAQKALQAFASEPRVNVSDADLQGFSDARTGSKLHCLERVASHINDIPWPFVGALIRVGLADEASKVRAQACDLATRWGAINGLRAARLRELLRQTASRDPARRVRMQASAALREIALVEEIGIELELGAVETTFQPLKTCLPAFQKKLRIVELQVSHMKRRLHHTRTSGQRFKLGDEHVKNQTFLEKLRVSIERIQGSSA
jgi:hypothetical protein